MHQCADYHVFSFDFADIDVADIPSKFTHRLIRMPGLVIEAN